MKLYYTPGVCSLAPHIVLYEAGIAFEAIRVDLKAKKTESGEDYLQISERGGVPLLELDNGEKLTEGVAIMQYLADLKPELKLAPANGTFERSRLQESLNFIATEIHKAHWPLFYPDQAGEKARDVYTEKLKKAYDHTAKKLTGKEYLCGSDFTIADAYLFTILGWSKKVHLDLSAWPTLVEYQKRIGSRSKVVAAMNAEGLLEQKAA